MLNIYLGAQGASVDDLMMEQVIEGTVNTGAAVQGTLLVLTGMLLLFLLHRTFGAKNWKNQSAVPGELKTNNIHWEQPTKWLHLV